MAIFAKRTLARLLAELAPLLPPDKHAELRARLGSAPDGDGPISAEWELAVFSGLRTSGTIEFPGGAGRQPDLIYTSTSTGERAMVEITAVSDRGLREKNPVDEFSRRLGKIAYKLRPIVGTLDYRVGSREVDGEVILGVPERAGMAAFFRSDGFREFIARIRKAPGEAHRYDFECRGSHGSIAFQPGQRFSSGSYPSFDHIHDLRRNPIVSRLRKKDQQLRESAIALPGIVVMADGDCAVLKSRMTALGKPRFEETVDVFLNGRPHQQAGPLVLQQGIGSSTRRINAIVIIAAHEEHHVFGAGVKRSLQVRYAFNHGPVYRSLSTDTLESLCAGLQRNMPPIRTSPLNARRTYPYPFHYGGWSLSGGPKGTMKIKMSLLTLQGLLDGSIKQSEFARDHPDLETRLLKNIVEGRMISDLRIERCPDEDDDWVHIEFAAPHPDRLFNPVANGRRGLHHEQDP